MEKQAKIQQLMEQYAGLPISGENTETVIGIEEELSQLGVNKVWTGIQSYWSDGSTVLAPVAPSESARHQSAVAYVDKIIASLNHE